jgi:membrane protease YdiL (CAAX protease family)
VQTPPDPAPSAQPPGLPQRPPPPLHGLPGGVLAAIYVAIAAAMVVAALFSAGIVAAAVAAALGRRPPSDAAGIQALLQHPLVLAATALLQDCALVGAAVLVIRWAGWGLGPTLAWRPAPAAAWGAGILVGCSAGLVAAWLASLLADVVPTLGADWLEAMERAMSQGPLLQRIPFWIVIVALAPVMEELVFRGFLWGALSRSVGRRATLLLTTFAFCAIHMDPLQMLALLPVGLAFGFLRLATGSIVPAIAAHALNNSVALASVLAFGPGASPDPPLPLVGACAAATLLGCALAWRACYDPGSPGPSS